MEASVEGTRVQPLRARDEALALGRFLVALYLLLFLLIWGNRDPAKRDSAPYPFQTRFVDLEPDEQRRFREASEGLVEALMHRSETGIWPGVEALRTQGIPPFAPHPLDREHYRWSLSQEGRSFRYVGVAEAPRASYLIVITEPDPRSPDLSHMGMQSLDALHRRLDDGTILDVGIWLRYGMPPGPVSLSPQSQGWLQIVVDSAADRS